MSQQEINIETGIPEMDIKKDTRQEPENNDYVHLNSDMNGFIRGWLKKYELQTNTKIDSFNDEKLKEIVNSIESNNNILNKYNFIYDFIRKSIEEKLLDGKTISNSINQDYNFLSLDIVRRLIKEEFISIKDLEFSDINVEIENEIKNLLIDTYDLASPSMPRKELKTDKNSISTQIYFWGLPSSGKTCVLGSLVSFMSRSQGRIKLCQPDGKSPGYEYMHGTNDNSGNKGVVGIFTLSGKRQTILLPGSTPPQYAYNTNYTLKIDDEKGKTKDCQVSIIDFAGETLNKIYDIVTRSDENEKKKENLKKLLPVLFENKKGKHQMHFFLIDYCNDNFNKQNNVLLQTAQYIKEEGLFGNNTKRISIIVTKIDKTGWNAIEDQKRVAEEFVTGRDGYRNFKGALDAICKEYQIGKVDVIPYSVGKLYFQRICIPDTIYPNELFNKIYEYGLYPTPSKWWSLIKN